MGLDLEKKAIRRKKGLGHVQEVLLHIIIADEMMSKSEIKNQNVKVQDLEARTNIPIKNITILQVLQESQKSSLKRVP